MLSEMTWSVPARHVQMRQFPLHPIVIESGLSQPAARGGAEGAFEDETLSILTRVRASIGEALTVFPGGVQKSHDIQKWLGVSFNVSWHIFRMMHAEHLLDIAPHVPGPGPMKRLLVALGKNGVPKESIVAIEEAYRAFEKHVEKSSGDRVGFGAMTSRGGSGETDAQQEFSYRRSLFEGHRFVTGVEQEAYVASMIMHPTKGKPGRMDQVSLALRKNLQCLRAGTEIMVDSTYVRKSVTMPAGEDVISGPLDAESYEKYGFYLLPEYCSQSGVVFERELKSNGVYQTKWKAEGVGRMNAIDIVSGRYSAGEELGKVRGEIYGRQTWTMVTKPTRKMIKDVIIHRSAYGAIDFDLSRWGYIMTLPAIENGFKLEGVPRLPCTDRMSFMGGIDAGGIPEFPKYLSLVRESCERFGWRTEDMHLYRLRIDYPILHVLHDVTVLFPKWVPPGV